MSLIPVPSSSFGIRFSPAALALAVAFGLAGVSDAGVLVVQPAGTYPQISAAVAAAAENDVILVKSGTYVGFTVDNKGVWIVGDAGANVNVNGTIAVTNLAAGKTFVMRNVKVNNTTGATREGLAFTNCAGNVRVEEGTFRGRSGGNFVATGTFAGADGALVTGCASVAFTRATLEGGDGANVDDDNTQTIATNGGRGLAATGSHVVLYDDTLRSGKGGYNLDGAGDDGGDGGDAARADGATLFASGCTFDSDDGGFGGPNGLTVCCGDGGDGGDGLELAGGVVFRSLANTYLPGNGGAPGCATCGTGPAPQPGAAGMAIRVISGTHIAFEGFARHNVVTTPVREGQSVTHTFQGENMEIVLLAVSAASGHTTLGAYHGVYLLESPAFFFDFGEIDGLNPKTVSFTIPELGSGVSSVSLHVQAFFASGGSAALGPLTEHVLLDSSF